MYVARFCFLCHQHLIFGCIGDTISSPVLLANFVLEDISFLGRHFLCSLLMPETWEEKRPRYEPKKPLLNKLNIF